ncbi:MAG: LamG domain-containing protein, partial [Sedimentisphaerales bacterium]|nr:LamG domain-containing protein [Sedimentisphaerales bacterium]
RDWLQSDLTVNPAAITTGPVAWYNFENNLLDSSPNGNNGTAQASETYVASRAGMGMALDFNGVADAVDCGNDASVDIVGDVTMSAWIKLTGSGADRKVGGNQSGNGGYKMTIFTDDVLEFEIRDSTGANALTRNISGGTALSPGVWYYVACVCSSTDGYVRTYVDGNVDKDMAMSRTMAATGANLILGREPYSSENFFSGTMDDVRIYNYALTPGQVLTVGGLGSMYQPVTSPANISDLEPTNEKKVNFKDYSVLMDSWGDKEEWPSW